MIDEDERFRRVILAIAETCSEKGRLCEELLKPNPLHEDRSAWRRRLAELEERSRVLFAAGRAVRQRRSASRSSATGGGREDAEGKPLERRAVDGS